MRSGHASVQCLMVLSYVCISMMLNETCTVSPLWWNTLHLQLAWSGWYPATVITDFLSANTPDILGILVLPSDTDERSWTFWTSNHCQWLVYYDNITYNPSPGGWQDQIVARSCTVVPLNVVLDAIHGNLDDNGCQCLVPGDDGAGNLPPK